MAGIWPDYVRIVAAELSSSADPAPEPARFDDGSLRRPRGPEDPLEVRRVTVAFDSDADADAFRTWLRDFAAKWFAWADPADGILREARVRGGAGGVEWTHRTTSGRTVVRGARMEIEGRPRDAVLGRSIWDPDVPLGAASGVYLRDVGGEIDRQGNYDARLPDAPIPEGWTDRPGRFFIFRVRTDGHVNLTLRGPDDASGSVEGPTPREPIRAGLAVVTRTRSDAVAFAVGLGTGADDPEPYRWTEDALIFDRADPVDAIALVWAGDGSPINLGDALTSMAGVDPASVLTDDDPATLLRASSPERAVSFAVEISHSALPAPVRVVDDVAPRRIDGAEYAAVRFGVRLAQDAEGENPRAELVIDNVGRDLMQWIEAAGGAQGATARVMQVRRGESDPDWEMTLDVTGVEADQAQVRAALGFDPLLGRAAVAVRHDPQTSPGLF